MTKLPRGLMELPGADLVSAGLAHVTEGRVTQEACLVSMLVHHLKRAGIVVGDAEELVPEPERTLYRLLGEEVSVQDPYPRYNALRRRIASFARAMSNWRRNHQA
jgi:hypothetical protein